MSGWCRIARPRTALRHRQHRLARWARTPPDTLGTGDADRLTVDLVSEPLSGEWLRYKTDRRESYTRTLGRLNDALALKFVNIAEKPEGMIKFANQHGLPLHGYSDKDGLPLADFWERQSFLRSTLDAYRTGQPRRALDLFQASAQYYAALEPELTLLPGAGDRIGITLAARNLYAFMALELAAIMAGGVQIRSCLNDRALFVSGTYQGRRAGAVYCCNRCRVAHQRARAKASHNPPKS